MVTAVKKATIQQLVNAVYKVAGAVVNGFSFFVFVGWQLFLTLDFVSLF